MDFHFYLVQLGFLFVCWTMFLQFRCGMEYAFNISQKKHRKGFRNFWFYKGHYEIGVIRTAYHVNRILLFAIWGASGVTLFLGYFAFIQPILIVWMAVLGVALIPAFFFGQWHWNKAKFGKPLILFRKDRSIRGIQSVFADIFFCTFPIFLTWYNVVFFLL